VTWVANVLLSLILMALCVLLMLVGRIGQFMGAWPGGWLLGS
jgi:hypothetical protein